MKALIVPSDPDLPCRVVDIKAGGSSLKNLQEAVGGYVDVQAHEECDIWVNDEGRLIDLPANVRVSWWMLNESAAARQGRVGESMVMYGDAVLTGPADNQGDITAVSDELVEHFQSMKLAREAVNDWDIRDTSIIVTDWPDAGEGQGFSHGI